MNGDGFVDHVGNYRTRETGIVAGDTEACLSGDADGSPFLACDSVRTIG